MLKLGSRGNSVKELQKKLNSLGFNAGVVDGIFGTKTRNAVMDFQRKNGLVVDGIVGKATRSKLNSSSNNDVKTIQEILNQIGIDVGKVDNKMGNKTRQGIREFQKIFGLTVDGIAGKNTWAVLNKAKGITHFKVQEFACKHCKDIKIDINLLVKLEELRKAVGNKPLVIRSGYRCPTHNRNVGGASKSQHIYGKAVDISHHNIGRALLERHADRIFANGGVGLGGNNIVHVDTRNGKARWRYN
mgnify:CR=1 FL=1